MKIKLLILSLFIWVGSFAQSVPNTNTFTLSDVTSVVAGIGSNDLVECFAHAVDAYFDATYKGSKNSLYNFRNYTIPSVTYYQNTYQSCSASRDDCGVGYHSPETYYGHVDADSYSSTISVADANIDAQYYCQSDIQAYANSQGSCVPDEVTYYSAAISATYTRNNCGGDYCGYSGTITIAYGTYTSTVSQAAVDATAQAAAQASANATFGCYYCGIAMVQ